MKNTRFILFIIFAVICIAVPLSIIWKHEDTLRNGTAYKFRTEPVDPYDAFRGRYVTLSFADDTAKLKNSPEEQAYSQKKILYVRLKVDAEGFAVPKEASKRPMTGDDVITVDRSWFNKSDFEYRLTYPFNRYYLEESIAPQAEELYRQANRRNDKKHPGYVIVRVKHGVGVLEELYIDGMPINETIKKGLSK